MQLHFPKYYNGIKFLTLVVLFSVHNLSVKAQSGTNTHPVIYLTANPPQGTTSVQFLIDEMQYCELTDLYARKTNTTPVWTTCIDPQWLDAGSHKLQIVGTVNGNKKKFEERVIQGLKVNQPNKLSLTGGWDFATSKEISSASFEGEHPEVLKSNFEKSKWSKVFVPNSIGTTNNKWNNYEGILAIYKKNFNINFKTGEQLYAYLESCYWSGRVFINGKFAGETHGGYLPTRFDISKFTRQGKNEIAVIADNRFSTMGIFKRLNEFYWNWGGLLQEIYIEKNPSVSLTDLRAQSSMDGTVQMFVTGMNNTNSSKTENISVAIYDQNNVKVFENNLFQVQVPSGQNIIPLKKIALKNPVLWELEKPYLYTVVVSGSFGTLKEITGFRDIKVSGADIMLNGKLVNNLQGFDRHADYPGLGRTQPAGLVYDDLKMLHDKGFRLFRPAHYPTTPAMLDAADELGFLVIEEINVTGLKGDVLASKEVKDFGAQQLTKMIERDRSHPSIIAWSVGNENFTEQEGAVDYVSATIGVGRALDPTRLYTQVTHRHTTDKTFKYQDFVAQNYYAGWYAKDINAIVNLFDAIQSYSGNKPVMLSEYGAEAIPGKEGTGKSTEFYQGFVVDAHNRLLNDRKHFFGKMYWCSTDFWCRPNWTGGSPDPRPPFHYKSLMSIDRTYKKLGWKVMFSPIRLILNPHIVKANDLGGDVILKPDIDTSFTELITIKETKGKSVQGKLMVEMPEGFKADKTEVDFSLAPGASLSIPLIFTGKINSNSAGANCIIRAVIDADTEAQPLLLVLKTKDETK